MQPGLYCSRDAFLLHGRSIPSSPRKLGPPHICPPSSLRPCTLSQRRCVPSQLPSRFTPCMYTTTRCISHSSNAFHDYRHIGNTTRLHPARISFERRDTSLSRISIATTHGIMRPRCIVGWRLVCWDTLSPTETNFPGPSHNEK